MRHLRLIILALFTVLALGLATLPAQVSASEPASAAVSLEAQGKGPGGKDKGNNGKDNAKKNKDDKGNKGNKGNNGQGQDDKGNNGNGGNDGVNAPGRGLGAWLRAFRSRWFGVAAGEDFGGWQLGRFKDAFPFAYPAGWKARERGDALLMSGSWQGQNYLFQMTRTIQVDYDSLREWVENDLDRLGVPESNARFVQAGRTEVAVVTGVKDPSYDCPVAYVYLWTQNPAGNNQRQAMGVVSQEAGAACDPAALNRFIDQYLAQVGGGALPRPLVTPTRTVSIPTATVAPRATPTPRATGWQQTRFFNAFSFAYPQGWTMDRLGDTAHLQGGYQNRSYVMDVVWVRSTPQSGLEQWVRADLADLGTSQEGTRINYVQQSGAQIGVASGVRMAGYDCPVVRVYVIANNPAGDGPRAFVATLAQANGQACDPGALENLALQMLQQV